MLKSYLKSALRGLQNNKGFTLINILGLALGLTASLLIIIYVVDELSYDRYNSNADRIYRVNEDLKLGNNKVQYAVSMPPLAQAMVSDLKEVEDAVRIKRAGSFHIKSGNELLREDNAFFADPSIFNVFTLHFIQGDPQSALKEPYNTVITASIAQKYFKSLNVVGRMLSIDNNQLIKITGVIKDMPKQSHFKADFLVSMATFPDSRSDKWLRSNYNTYVLLRQGADYKKLEAQLPELLRKYSNSQIQSELHMSMDEFEKGGSYFRLNLIPLTDIHLHSSMTGELGANSTTQYVYIFSVIAIFILLIACVNFMNLSTARSSNRACEVGIRKVLGSARKNLIGQFLFESTMVTCIAAIIAMAATYLLLPYFNQLSGKELHITTHMLSWLVPAVLAGVVIIGILAGSYPAFFLSAFQPVQVLKGKLSVGFKGSSLRSILVVFQFSISVFLIIGTLVIYNQLRYIQSRDLGYNRNQVLIVHNAYELGQHAQTFKQEIQQLPGVTSATLTSYLPTSGARNTALFSTEASPSPEKIIFPQTWYIDEDYIPTLDMKLIAGRNFSKQMPTDSAGLIINETAARFLGLKDVVNHVLYRSGGGDDPTFKPYHIIGVVKDFNFNSLRENVSPVIMVLTHDTGNLSIRLKTTDIKAVLSQIEHRWKELSPVHFEYSFMDQDFEAIYRSEQRVGEIVVIFTVLAILIASLGLFGLASYAAEQRTKEIGIRKVLGASVSAIVGMLSADFIKLVLLAIVIAVPVAWYAMHKWLQDFAYRTSIHWWMIVVAGFAAIIIAMLTISMQSVKAALANPVKSLRNE